MDELYHEKSDGYYRAERNEIVSLIPAGIERMLDVGCAAGDTAAEAKRTRGVRHVVGIEYVPAVAEKARSRIDEVITGDIEGLNLNFRESSFDCILCADVIEHTKDPWAVLRKLRAFLREDGILIASIPNFRHLHPILKIIFDRFEYMESGILDKTHLRIFTPHTMRTMFEESGFRIRKVQRTYSSRWMFRLARYATLGLLAPFTVYQYIFVLTRDESKS